MKKRFLSLILAGVLMAGTLPTISFAAKINGKITFVEASDNSAVTEFEDGDKICARLVGSAEGSANADVYAASYKEGELLGCKWLNSQPVMDGVQMDTTTKTIDISDGADEVKVFLWDMKNNNKPLLAPGVIYKKKAGGGVSSGVNNTNGVVGETVNLEGENVSANVPAGVQLASGATQLTLTMQKLDNSQSGILPDEGEELSSFDVHIEGVSGENNVPIIVTVENFAKEGYNKGNLTLYHVEKDGTKELSEVDDIEELIKHNTYHYNPENGTLTLALTSFSELAVVAETAQGWQGEVAKGFNGGTGTEEDPYIIANADQLAYFGKAVGGMLAEDEANSFEGEFVKLTADINLADDEAHNDEDKIFHPIGYYFNENYDGKGVYSTVSSFEGTFDGNGHTIANFYHNTWEIKGDYNSGYPAGSNHYKDAMGLFGYVVNGSVKNLTVDNFSSDGEFTPTGVIAAYATNSTFENIAITNCNPRVYNTGNGGIVGIGGESSDTEESKLTFTNITIDNTNKITALWGSWDVACGGLVGMFRGSGHVWMTNCHVAAQIDVFNDVCGNYQYYWYRYAGMLVGTNQNMIEKDGYTLPETDKYHAESCTVHFGKWNDYYYCELVANSLASYTHDHQFSRLEQVDSVDAEKMTVTVGDETIAIPESGRCNYVVVKGEASTENATCYHFVDGEIWTHDMAGEETVDVDGDGVKETVLKEDRQHYYLPFNQLFTGYGWGVKHIPIYNDATENPFNGVTILDREVADSVVKFKSATKKDGYITGTTITVGEIFAAADSLAVAIDSENVQVFVSPANEESTAGAVYIADKEDWTKGIVTFSGTGRAVITITDYNYCTPTTIEVNVVPENKDYAEDYNNQTGTMEIVNISSFTAANNYRSDYKEGLGGRDNYSLVSIAEDVMCSSNNDIQGGFIVPVYNNEKSNEGDIKTLEMSVLYGGDADYMLIQAQYAIDEEWNGLRLAPFIRVEDSKVYVIDTDKDTGNIYNKDTGIICNKDEWLRIVIEENFDAEKSKIYINGEDVDFSLEGNIFGNRWYQANFGFKKNEAARDGYIAVDDVKIYKEAYQPTGNEIVSYNVTDSDTIEFYQEETAAVYTDESKTVGEILECVSKDNYYGVFTNHNGVKIDDLNTVIGHGNVIVFKSQDGKSYDYLTIRCDEEGRSIACDPISATSGFEQVGGRFTGEAKAGLYQKANDDYAYTFTLKDEFKTATVKVDDRHTYIPAVFNNNIHLSGKIFTTEYKVAAEGNFDEFYATASFVTKNKENGEIYQTPYVNPFTMNEKDGIKVNGEKIMDFEQGKWYDIAVTWDLVNFKLDVYINGEVAVKDWTFISEDYLGRVEVVGFREYPTWSTQRYWFALQQIFNERAENDPAREGSFAFDDTYVYYGRYNKNK